MHVGRGGYCGVAPLSANAANVAFVVDRSQMAGAAADVAGFYLRTLRRWPVLWERLRGARLVAPPHSIGPLAVEPVRVTAPGVALVGDAAGFYDPFTGEGITLALRSAEILAPLADAALQADRSEALVEYETARREATRAKFLLNQLLQRLIAWPQLASGVARKLARRQDLADRLVGIAGDLVPAHSALGPSFLWDLFRA
jgi:flavin-dependent dehydrogenase